MWHANTKTKLIEINGNLTANISRISLDASSNSSLDMQRELIANVSSNVVNGSNSANVSSSSTVEAYEGRDVILTFVTESYPPLQNQHWTTPANINNNNNVTVYQESFTDKGFRLLVVYNIVNTLTLQFTKVFFPML